MNRRHGIALSVFFTILLLVPPSSRAGTGGYTMLTSADPGGPPPEWIDTASGTLVTGLADDNAATAMIPLPQNFWYFGTNVNAVKIGSNGWVGFSNISNISLCFPTVPTPGGPGDNFVAPFMADLTFNGGGNPGTVRTLDDSANGRFVVSYVNVPYWVVPDGWSGSTTFQVVLEFATGVVRFNYLALSPFQDIGCTSVVVGIESPTGVDGLAYSHNAMPPTPFSIVFIPPADVSLTKTLVTAGPYTHDQSISYSLVAANAGPSNATNIQVSDTPNNLTITNVSGSGCATLPCTIGSLASGANSTITVTATINAAGAFDNSAVATAAEPDPDSTNNTDNSGNGGTAAASADVSLVKTLASAGPWSAGQSLSYSVVVTNAGPSTATNIQVGDTPLNLTITNVAGSGCAALPCTIASLAAGANATIIVTATIDAAGAFDNSAVAAAAEPDPNIANNNDDTGNGGTAAASADVSVTKTLVTAGPYSHDQSLSYSLIVANDGPSTATNIQVTDTPTNLTITNVSGSGCAALPCTIASLTSGANSTITVTATINGTGPFDNSAVATAAESDPNNADNADITGNGGTAAASADMQVAKSGPAAVIAGDTISYTVTLTNNGPSAASNVSLTDATPADTTFVSIMQNSGPLFSCATPLAGGTGDVTCTAATMAAGASAVFTIVDAVDVNKAANTTITNTATVTATSSDPAEANNSASLMTAVSAGVADLSVIKSPSPGPYGTDMPITFSIVVSNAGPADAAAVTVNDALSAGTVFISANATQGTCGGAPNLTCSLGTLPAGASATITLALRLPSVPGPFTNTATVSSANADSAPSNNSRTATINVIPAAQIPTLSTIILMMLGATMALLALMRIRS